MCRRGKTPGASRLSLHQRQLEGVRSASPAAFAAPTEKTPIFKYTPYIFFVSHKRYSSPGIKDLWPQSWPQQSRRKRITKKHASRAHAPSQEAPPSRGSLFDTPAKKENTNKRDGAIAIKEGTKQLPRIYRGSVTLQGFSAPPSEPGFSRAGFRRPDYYYYHYHIFLYIISMILLLVFA